MADLEGMQPVDAVDPLLDLLRRAASSIPIGLRRLPVRPKDRIDREPLLRLKHQLEAKE